MFEIRTVSFLGNAEAASVAHKIILGPYLTVNFTVIGKSCLCSRIDGRIAFQPFFQIGQIKVAGYMFGKRQVEEIIVSVFVGSGSLSVSSGVIDRHRRLRHGISVFVHYLSVETSRRLAGVIGREHIVGEQHETCKT